MGLYYKVGFYMGFYSKVSFNEGCTYIPLSGEDLPLQGCLLPLSHLQEVAETLNSFRAFL